MSVRERVRAQVRLTGRMSEPGLRPTAAGSTSLHVEVDQIVLTEDGSAVSPAPPDYHRAEPDPLHQGAAEQLQHLAGHHPDAIDVLSRLCGRAALIGAIRIVPVALDRYGVVLRIERLRDHRDVRLPFRERIDNGAEAAIEMRHLLAEGRRRRPCGRHPDLR